MSPGVATNLVGRWASGRYDYKNKDYVNPEGGGFPFREYTKQQLKTLTEHQMTEEYYRETTDRIVAVTVDGSGRYAGLVFWILVEGVPTRLYRARVMPEGWEPEIAR